MAMLEVHELHVSYGAIEALHGISFKVESGQVVTLIGANGAGKSTTLNALSGLVRAKSGRILFDGQDITHWRPDQISSRGLVQVPEGRQVIAPLSVQENLEVGAHSRGSDPEIPDDIEKVFERFPRLKERRYQKAGSLSGGEQQMLAVGRALMMRPRLLMLDEPSMGLAPILVNEVFRIIEDIKAQGTTILLVEQNARKALQIADYACMLDRGTLVRSGASDELRTTREVIEAYLG